MKKPNKKTLILAKETVRVLHAIEFQHVVGGGVNGTVAGNGKGLSCTHPCDTGGDTDGCGHNIA